MTYAKETAMRVLKDEELALISGSAGFATTLALGEEDDAWCGGWVTTMALGEEDPFGHHVNVSLDMNIHLGVEGQVSGKIA